MLISEIREAIPNKDLDYQLDFLKRVLKLRESEMWKNGQKKKNYLLVGCALSRTEVAEIHCKYNYSSSPLFLQSLGITRGSVPQRAKRLYNLLVEKGILAHQIDELNAQINGRFDIDNLYVQLGALRTKEDCLKLLDYFYKDKQRKKDNSRFTKTHGFLPYYNVKFRLKRKYAYGDMLVDFRTADLFSSVRGYLKDLAGGNVEDIEIVKCLAVKALIEKPTEKKVVSWCRFYGIKPIYAALLLGAISTDLDPKFLSLEKLTTNITKLYKNKIGIDYRSAIERTIALFGDEQ